MASYQSCCSFINEKHTILDYVILDFHTNTKKNAIPKELICNMDVNIHDSSSESESFGCLEMQAGETTINIDPLFFLFSIDDSASMSEICKDGKTKMEHVHFTMNQMLHYFAENPEATIYVNVTTFNDKVKTVIDTTLISHNNVNEIIEKIKKIRPTNSTNLELALKTANQTMDDYVTTISKKNQQHRIVHILLTDGCPTAGDCDDNNLSSLVNDKYCNTFIAFGVDHNPILMNKLGNVGKNTSNYLIEKLELIGNVYGEVVYNQLFKVLDNVILNIDKGYIYDWYTNEWKTKLHLGSLSNEVKKFYYIKSSEPNNCIVEITGRPIDRDAGLLFKEYVNKVPDLLIMDSNDNVEGIVDVDLTKHILRLCTQRLLYESRQYAADPDTIPFTNVNINDSLWLRQNRMFNNNLIRSTHHDELLSVQEITEKTKIQTKVETEILYEEPQSRLQILKQKINKHINYMYNYNYLNTTKQDEFIQKLCEDMEISLKTLGTKNQQIYLNARSRSQGTQQMYNVTIDNDFSENENNHLSVNNVYATPSAIKIMREFSA